MKDHGGGGPRSRGPRAFSIRHVRIRCKDVNIGANLIRHLGHLQNTNTVPETNKNEVLTESIAIWVWKMMVQYSCR
jgi:hypothetical protein